MLPSPITQVSYNVTNFLEKNKDALHEDIRAVICSSTCSLYAGLLPPPESAAKEAARYDVCSATPPWVLGALSVLSGCWVTRAPCDAPHFTCTCHVPSLVS